MYFILFLQEEVAINYNKLHADPKQGKSLDISKSLKKEISMKALNFLKLHIRAYSSIFQSN